LSKWRSPLDVYLDKRGESQEQPDNDSMLWGRTLEPVIRQRYKDVTCREVTVPGEILVSDRYPWMLASLDGLCKDRVLEVKTARSVEGWGEEGSDEIPEAYLIQVQHYLTVTKLSLADVAVLIGGSDFRIYTVQEDHHLQSLIVQREAELWDRIQAGNPPDPVTYADMRTLYGRESTARRVQATPNAFYAIEKIRAIKAASKEEEALKAVVMGLLGDADTLVDGETVLATWKAGKGTKRFDLDKFKAEHPGLYAQYLATGESTRRFLLK
jgi:putative phage-type endonuclease